MNRDRNSEKEAVRAKSLKPAAARCRSIQPKKHQRTFHNRSLHGEDRVMVENPYERCSIFGAALVAAEVFDADFCVHGPQGCTSAIKEAFAVQGAEYDYHHSGMKETDIIFGGEKCLIKVLTEAFSPYEKAGPKFIVTSCSSEIIGDNVDAVAERVNKGLPLVKVPSGGIKGNQYRGINQALIGLVEKFADKTANKKANSVNLIGNIGLSRQWKGDLHELERLLRGLGLDVNLVACDSTIDNFRRVPAAVLNIILTPEAGLEACEFMHDKFGIPYVCSPLFLPLGLRGTEAWLREIGNALNIGKKTIDEFLGREEEKVRLALKVGLNQMVYTEKLSILRGLPVSIIAEGSVAYSWARFAAEELDMKPVFIGLRTGGKDPFVLKALDSLQEEFNIKPMILSRLLLDEVREALLVSKTRFIIGSSVEADLGEQIGISGFLHIANPNTQFVSINRTPYLGFRGLLNAVETILNSMKDDGR